MRILVTGADGFVGTRLIERLVRDGHDVLAGVHPDRPILAEGGPAPWGGDAQTVPLEICDGLSVRRAFADRLDAVVHLAGVSSGRDAARAPDRAREINAEGTARIAGELGRQRQAGESDVLMLMVSTAEVYGGGASSARRESDTPKPASPYAVTKLAGEDAVRAVADQTGLRALVARAFPHTGRGQDRRFVVPAFAWRLHEAKARGDAVVHVGNLAPVRECLHVRDVIEAYLALLQDGEPGEVYNVACGTGVRLADIFSRLAELVGHHPDPLTDPELLRADDIPHLVGDPAKLHARTGWEPRITLDQTLAEVVDAQAH